MAASALALSEDNRSTVQFQDISTQIYFQGIVDATRGAPKTLESLRRATPPAYFEAMVQKYGESIEQSPEEIWPFILREISFILLAEAVKFRNSNLVTIPALMLARARLYPRMAVIPSEYPRTYLISGASGIDHQPLRRLMSRFGFEEVTTAKMLKSKERRIGFICLEQSSYTAPNGKQGMKYDSRVYKFEGWVKSISGPSRFVITDKGQLYEEMGRRFPELQTKYMIRTKRVQDISSEEAAGKIWIVKPTTAPDRNAGEGYDIEIVQNYEDLMTIGDRLRQKHHSEPIASEYILDPWLLDGRKCHLRMLFLIRTAGMSQRGTQVEFGYFLWDQGVVATAAKPFELKHFQDKRIHDSHGRTTDRDFYFNLTDPDPTDTGMTLEQRKYIFAQMEECCVGLGEIMRQYMLPYEDSVNAYETFGLDFMVHAETMQIVLLEANDHIGRQSISSKKLPGYNPATGPYTDKHKYFSRDYWGWAYQHGIAPFFN